jgi:hypothetical protein
MLISVAYTQKGLYAGPKGVHFDELQGAIPAPILASLMESDSPERLTFGDHGLVRISENRDAGVS